MRDLSKVSRQKYLSKVVGQFYTNFMGPVCCQIVYSIAVTQNFLTAFILYQSSHNSKCSRSFCSSYTLFEKIYLKAKV